MMYHNTKELYDLPLDELEKIRRQQADLYAKEKNKRYNAIAAILYYQSERKKLEDEGMAPAETG